MKEQRAFLQIDGSNFYHRLKELDFKNLLNFNYGKFTQFLLKGDSKNLVRAKYYIGAIRTESDNPKSFELWRNQRILIGQLRKYGFEIGFGHILKTDSYHEKGIDVQISVDMLIGAYENTYDMLFLVSSDTDLLPAVEKAKELGKIIHYIGFSHKPSHAMITNSSLSYLLRKEDLKEFFR